MKIDFYPGPRAGLVRFGSSFGGRRPPPLSLRLGATAFGADAREGTNAPSALGGQSSGDAELL